jgi:hypothetical protein
VPDRLEVCGLLFALSVTVSVPVAVPVFFGENVTLIVHFFLLPSVAVQVEVETANGAPVEYEMPLRVVGELFVSVNLYAALVAPTFVLGNLWLLGVSVTAVDPRDKLNTVP